MLKIIDLLFGWIPQLINIRKQRAEAMMSEFQNFKMLIDTQSSVIEGLKSDIKDMRETQNTLLIEIRSLNEQLCDCLHKLNS